MSATDIRAEQAKRLIVSFSGGRTSAYMTKRILDTWRDKYTDIVVLFANTGQEHEKTLEFVRNCDTKFGFNTVWLEAIINGNGKGSTHKIVTFETQAGRVNHTRKGLKNTAFPT